MELATFLLFSVTTLVVILTPGPAAIAVTSMAAGNGFRRGVAAIAGVASANAVFFGLSALGVSALILASEILFTLIKWVGVAYLLYLGWGAFTGKANGLSIRPGEEQPALRLYRRGCVVEFANPKALLYFAAILPQFLDLAAPIAPLILILGTTTLLLDFTVYSIYAALGNGIARSGMSKRLMRTLDRLAGAALLFAAFRIARITT